MPITTLLLLLGVVLALIYLLASLIMGRQVIIHNRHSSAYTLGYSILNEEIDPRILTLPWEVFELNVPLNPAQGHDKDQADDHDHDQGPVTSHKHITLRGQLLDKSALRTVIFCHGITWTRYGMFKYLEPFLDGSWNIIFYDHRAHGESGGKYPTFGAFERQDLGRIVQTARDRWPESSILLYGESMGAATVLQYLADDRRVDAAIADCPYNNLRAELKHQLACMRVPRVFHAPLLAGTRLYVKQKAEFDFNKVDPQQDALNSMCPLFLAHGASDNYVPTRMSEELYKVRSSLAPTSLYLTPEAEHAKSIVTDRSSYLQAVRSFLAGVKL